MSIDRVREVAHRLLVSTGALAALGTALELQTTSATVAPELEVRLTEVLRILGIDAELEGVSTEALAALLAEMRLTFLQGVKLLSRSTLQPGWIHTEEELLQSQGQALLEERGFDRVQVLPSPPWALAALVVGRRPL